jgi:transposase InsO family protein
VSDKYAAIAVHQGQYPVRLMCEVLGVSPSGFYAAQGRAPGARAAADERLRVEVRVAHRKSKGRYGAPRVHRALRAAGTRVGKKRVARVMREDGLVARRVRRRVRTTDSAHALPVAPNVVARGFAVADQPGLNRTWTADFTYIPTRVGWLFLAVVLDLASRKVVGWAVRETMEAELVLAALQMALADRRPAPGLVVHSDRGSQYASGAHRALLAAHGAVASMSGKGDCWDSAVTEAFFATLEHELLTDNTFLSRAAARAAIFDFIVWYNVERLYSSLDYVCPGQYEQHLRAQPARAA